MKVKHCPRCTMEKAATDFGRNRQSPDGLNYYCKLCAALKQRAWVLMNKAKVKVSRQKYLNKIRTANAGVNPYA